MLHKRWYTHKYNLCTVSIILLSILLASCGGTSTSNSSASTGYSNAAVPHSSSSSSSKRTALNGQNAKDASAAPRYLIKTLTVNMEVSDTKSVADSLQGWIMSTDPQASSAGVDYEQIDPNHYSITMTFAVRANLYPQVQRYLRDYAPQHGGHLDSMTETVQDVSNDYVDTQSRLTTLKTEQARLRTLMSQAKALSDVLAVEQRLTDVEQQIESTEASLKTLDSQITFYPITIALQPIIATTPQPNPAWNAGQSFRDAFAAALSFGQGILTFLIWLLAFSMYIVPMGIALWLVIRWLRRTQPSVATARRTSPPTTP